MSEQDGYVKVGVSAGIAWITLSDPAKLNAVTPARIRELNLAAVDVGRRPDVDVVIVTGSGRGFCSGADLTREELSGPLPPASGSVVGPESMWTLAAMPQPVIAMINGPAVGYGCELVLQADIRIASSSAFFALPFAKLGTISDTGAGSWLLPRLIGMDHAAELLYTGRRWDAGEALKMGMVTAVVAPDRLRTTTLELAESMIRNSAWSLRATKRLLWAGLEQRRQEHLLMQHVYQETGDPQFDTSAYRARFAK